MNIIKVVWEDSLEWDGGHKVQEIPMAEWLKMYQTVLPKLKDGTFISRIFAIYLNQPDD